MSSSPKTTPKDAKTPQKGRQTPSFTVGRASKTSAASNRRICDPQPE
jgi:hypothetical protein